ncbi:ATP-binding cassette domain-containing protein [Neptunicella marina]|uniref:ATP-binding cassette domain-containing protein n=1 Tax=Neptunicella marina TaxID=2125989 RepID=A0A8J6IU91_9ALTE|nr:ATP-binding cassette domain-containing protein [Neptunicella marina]MBC3766439.1 ATP-binding cassette domain-containing protein [Neptunicella marina]
MSSLLEVKDLSYCAKSRGTLFKREQSFKLEPINFELQSGETMAIIGDNGSGKSTVAKLLVGAAMPDSGSIILNGETMQPGNIKQRCLKIRMVFQHSQSSLNPGLTLGALLDEPLKLNTEYDGYERRRIIEETLVKVGLMAEHAHFYAHMLSEGQKQRVAVARALILNPEVIVADEPFAALDPSVRSQTVNLLVKLQQDLGVGFIFISHNLGIVRHISDRILVMRHGKVIEAGKTDVIFNWPKHDYTKKLIYAYQSLSKR